MDNATLMWVGGILFSVIGALIGAIWTIVWGAIKDLRAKLSEESDGYVNNLASLNNSVMRDLATIRAECAERSREVYNKLDEERKERQDKHDKTTERLFGRIESLQQKVSDDMSDVNDSISDLRETVAGFGSIYVTRREWMDGVQGLRSILRVKEDNRENPDR